MFLSIFKKKNKGLKKKVEKKNHRIAMLGMSVYVDWYAILIAGFLLLIIAGIHSYSTYTNLYTETGIEIVKDKQSVKVDIEKLNRVLSDFNF